MNIQRQLSHLKLTNISKENKRVQNQRRSSENLTCCEIFHVHANSEKFSLESRFQMHSNCTDYILKHKLVWMSMPKFCEAKFYSVTQKITHAIKKKWSSCSHIYLFQNAIVTRKVAREQTFTYRIIMCHNVSIQKKTDL